MTEQDLTELSKRLERIEGRLLEGNEGRSRTERQRREAKAEGVRLARSCVRDMLREGE